MRADNPLVRAVARIPAKLRTKLLASFLTIAALLVLVSLLGVRVLGQANSRSERLRTLQTHRAGYQAVEAQATIVRAPPADPAGSGSAPTPRTASRLLVTVLSTNHDSASSSSLSEATV